MLAQPTQHTAAPLSKQRQLQQQQQQVLQEEQSLQSVNSLSMFPDPVSGCGTSSRAAAAGGRGTAAAAVAAARSVLPELAAARLREQRQHALVVSACKALGSSAAADAYVAALPAGLLTVNLSSAGDDALGCLETSQILLVPQLKHTLLTRSGTAAVAKLD
jgi:hypothetical protein